MVRNTTNEIIQYIEIPGITLHCRILGQGSPVVFLHGFGQSNRIYADIERELAGHHQLILLDSRGHGLSSFDDQPVTTRLMAADVVQVLDYLKIETCFVVGFSDGGNIALQLAVDFPSRLQGIVAISSNARPDGLKPNIIWLFKFGNWLLKLGAWLRIPSLARLSLLMPLLLEQPQITKQELQKITTPALLLWAEKDYMTQQHIEEVGTDIPGSKTLIINKSSHLSIVKKWPQYHKSVLDFLS